MLAAASFSMDLSPWGLDGSLSAPRGSTPNRASGRMPSPTSRRDSRTRKLSDDGTHSPAFQFPSVGSSPSHRISLSPAARSSTPPGFRRNRASAPQAKRSSWTQGPIPVNLLQAAATKSPPVLLGNSGNVDRKQRASSGDRTNGRISTGQDWAFTSPCSPVRSKPINIKEFDCSEQKERSSEDSFTEKARTMFGLIDSDKSDSVSKLELVAAVYRHQVVASFVLEALGLCSKSFNDSNGRIKIDEQSFDSISEVFDEMAGGKQRVKYAEFEAFFRRAVKDRELAASSSKEMKSVFDLIDTDHNKAVSKLEFVAAMQRHQKIAAYLLPGVNSRLVLQDESQYDAVCELFDRMAGGKQRIFWDDFERHCCYSQSYGARTATQKGGISSSRDRRSQVRVLVLGPGFGRQSNPRQSAVLVQAGFKVHWCCDLPERPDEVSGGPRAAHRVVAPYLGRLRQEIEEFCPHVLLCGSQGGAYLVALWHCRYWRGPTVMINAHPSLPMRLPAEVPIVLAHGSNDEAYRWSREDLESLVSTGSPNKCFLYYTANSGQVSSGSYTRLGDSHAMTSIVAQDCLPRLVDACLATQGPEAHILQTWNLQLGSVRSEAEHWLGYTPERLRRLWSSPSRQGATEQKLYDVPRSSEEFKSVASIFKAEPAAEPAYMLSSQSAWQSLPIVKIQRVENGLQIEGGTVPYRDALRRSLSEQGTEFEPGTHTCWAFHGADHHAIESIVNNPDGFQPLASGARNSSVWGSGTYFARDAKYVADGQFCVPKADGTRSMLLCLLTLGMPCLGSPRYKGVLPFRQKPHRYNSSVDSMSCPEIYVVQHPGAAHPAYVITFA